MPSRTAFVALVVVVLALAGCGSTKKTTSTATTSSVTAPATTTPVGSATYSVTTKPTPPAATSPVTAPTTRTSGAPPPAKSASYSVSLAGTSGGLPGAPNGSGLAVISLNASSDQLCWKFSQLKNVTAPTVAKIYKATPHGPGTAGLPLGSAYSSSGCVTEPSIFLGAIGAHPQRFYVSIHDAQFPGGAVRGQL
jgi:hypothetical protein